MQMVLNNFQELIKKMVLFVSLIIPSDVDNKIAIENAIKQKMAEITGDDLWINSSDEKAVKTLTLEHHMAEKRMGFDDLFASLYKVERYRIGLLDGSLPGIRFFTQFVLPLIEAKGMGMSLPFQELFD